MTISNQDNSEIFLIFFSLMSFFGLLAGFIIYFVVLYQNKQRINKQDQENLKFTFHQELMQAQLEIQEQTLNNVSLEIHDNIGQILSFVKLSMGTIKALSNEEKDERINENRELIAQAINDLRDLSKSLSKDNIATKGFIPTIETEVNRISKSGLINIELQIEGDAFALGDQRELVLFRILQESLNNTLKHSGADFVKISLLFCSDLFTLTVSDNGSGFDYQDAKSKNGSGLKNIRNRANLIGADVKINSAVGKGSQITVSLNPFEQQTYAHGNYSGSPG